MIPRSSIRRIGIIAIIAIIPNDAASEEAALPSAAPIARGRRNAELIGPVATPPESNAIAEKSPGVLIISSIITAYPGRMNVHIERAWTVLINAMTTADSVLVPIQCEYYALEGLTQLIHTIELVKERLNPNLIIEGVVFTMYDARTNLSLQVVENVKANLNQSIYKTIIPRNVRLAEAPSYGMPINLYDTRSVGAESYRLLADEVLHREDEE